MNVWYLPLEHIDRRYTKMMDEQLMRAFARRPVRTHRLYPEELPGEIVTGAFLDADGTNYFKAGQIRMVAEAFRKGRVKDGDKFFVSDLWFPGIEAIKYMAFFHNVKVELWGIMHAGSWTPSDFVAQMGPWCAHHERGWLTAADGVFVGSEFHRDEMVVSLYPVLMPECRDVKDKIHATGLAFDSQDVFKLAGVGAPLPWDWRENRVVFAGRLDDEKQPWLFDELAERCADTGAEFIKTYELDLSKADYFRLLSYSKVIFSAALQENFGYAVLEAATLGVQPVLPDRVVYPEFYGEQHRYADMDEAERLTRDFLTNPAKPYDPEWHDGGIERMLDTMLSQEDRK